MPETTQANADLTSELFDAITAGDRDALAVLLARGPELANARHESGLSPLMMATYHRRPELAELLLSSGAELDLFAAAARGEAERITVLLAEDPRLVGAHSPDGWTALHLAAHFGQTETVALLLIHGADVSARSANGLANTALHAAAAGRHSEVIELLLANGADVNAKQHGGFTALQAAAQHGDLGLVELLLAHGADPEAATDAGQTALTMAAEKGYEQVVAVLQGHVAADL